MARSFTSQTLARKGALRARIWKKERPPASSAPILAAKPRRAGSGSPKTASRGQIRALSADFGREHSADETSGLDHIWPDTDHSTLAQTLGQIRPELWNSPRVSPESINIGLFSATVGPTSHHWAQISTQVWPGDDQLLVRRRPDSPHIDQA